MKTLFLVLAFLLTPALAQATFVPYQFTLTITEIRDPSFSSTQTCVDFDTGFPLGVQFRCSLGDVIVGHFSVDDSLLALTGTNLPGTITNFFLQIGEVVWDQQNPGPLGSAFGGFRGPTGFGPSPGFDVAGGVITGLRGGVHSPADWPTTDFFVTRFIAEDWIDGNLITGTLSVERVPEPASLFLMALGVITLARVAKSRKDKSGADQHDRPPRFGEKGVPAFDSWLN
jgi:PEP-CTERM motif